MPIIYRAGTGGGTVDFRSSSQDTKVTSISVVAIGSDGTMTINGGNVITIRAGNSLTTNFEGYLIDPLIVMSSSLDYYIEGFES